MQALSASDGISRLAIPRLAPGACMATGSLPHTSPERQRRDLFLPPQHDFDLFARLVPAAAGWQRDKAGRTGQPEQIR
jgi:hypothetical protein